MPARTRADASTSPVTNGVEQRSVITAAGEHADGVRVVRRPDTVTTVEWFAGGPKATKPPRPADSPAATTSPAGAGWTRPATPTSSSSWRTGSRVVPTAALEREDTDPLGSIFACRRRVVVLGEQTRGYGGAWLPLVGPGGPGTGVCFLSYPRATLCLSGSPAGVTTADGGHRTGGSGEEARTT